MIFDSKVVFFFMCLLGLHKCRLATDGLQLEFRGKSILSNQSLLLELQLLFQDPCVELRCSSNEICVSNDANSAGCVPKQQIDLFAEYYLNKRETNEPETAQVSTEFVSPCNSNDCRYGECEILNLTSFKCHCVVVVTNQLSVQSDECLFFIFTLKRILLHIHRHKHVLCAHLFNYIMYNQFLINQT